MHAYIPTGRQRDIHDGRHIHTYTQSNNHGCIGRGGGGGGVGGACVCGGGACVV